MTAARPLLRCNALLPGRDTRQRLRHEGFAPHSQHGTGSPVRESAAARSCALRMLVVSTPWWIAAVATGDKLSDALRRLAVRSEELPKRQERCEESYQAQNQRLKSGRPGGGRRGPEGRLNGIAVEIRTLRSIIIAFRHLSAGSLAITCSVMRQDRRWIQS